MRQRRKTKTAKAAFTSMAILAAGLMSCAKPDEPRQAPMLPRPTKIQENQEKQKSQAHPQFHTRHELKVVRKGDHILRHYFPFEKPGVLSLKVDVIGKRGIILSGDTNIFSKKKPIWIEYGKTTDLYGSALVLTVHARKNGPDSAMVNVTFVADKP